MGGPRQDQIMGRAGRQQWLLGWLAGGCTPSPPGRRRSPGLRAAPSSSLQEPECERASKLGSTPGESREEGGERDGKNCSDPHPQKSSKTFDTL